MSTSGETMAKAYDPAATEARWYRFWVEGGYFKPRVAPGRPTFTIIMPPPNVTGDLHMGHALTNAVEDILIRWRRLQGYAALYLPGADHASIAAQNVVERRLAADKQVTRHDLGRERFLEQMWEWMDYYRPRMTRQLHVLGASADWDRYRFTMDDGPSRAVRKVFKSLYDEGLIYRGERMVNWCWRCSTVLSDLEVDHETAAGQIWYVRYPIEGEPGRWISVATTRPETILGDTGVAVHPDDERYRALVGRRAIVPVLGRSIPIVADSAVDPSFGTGAVKVTPAHDPVDFEIGQRHHLPALMVMNLDNTMNDQAGPMAGLGVDEARRRMLDWLAEHDQLLKVEEHTHAVGHCERCQTIVQPIISEQWFVKMQPLAKPAIQAALDGRIRFVPERFTRIYLNWLENIRDWTISRQLWWGHRIPVWYCENGHTTVIEEESLEGCPTCGVAVRQDEDVLDTWFSSALWPLTTLGWPDDTEDFRTFYPTQVMETGYDIIFFWVARMIFQGLHFTGQAPFHTVYLHGLVRDEHGRKMSKSLGNVVDPTELTKKYGSDALRFTLATGSSPGNDMKLSVDRLEHSRNFANKLWNATRFVLSSVDITALPRAADGTVALPPIAELSLADRWIVSRLQAVTHDATRLLEDFQLGEAGRHLYEFVWSEYCDWYIEASKTRLNGADTLAARATGQVLVHVLERALRLLHPYLPFITEELWQHLPHSGEALIVAVWPQPEARDLEAEEQFELLRETVRAIRNARAEHKVEPARWIEAMVVAGDQSVLFTAQRVVLAALARVDQERLTITASAPAPGQALALVVREVVVYLPLAGLVDLAAERLRLAKELEAAEREMAGASRMLDDQNFLAKARPDVVQRQRDRLTEAQERQAKLRQRLLELAV